MYGLAQHIFHIRHIQALQAHRLASAFRYPAQSNLGHRCVTTDVSKLLPHISVPALSSAKLPRHVDDVARQLKQMGILKISLGFPDDSSRYLEQLLVGLHERHGHQLPITHSATRGWFWDVRPSKTSFQTVNHQARSETMEEFPWHTDCSYEDPPPRFFALQVLRRDRCGGGVLSIMSVRRLSELLSAASRAALAQRHFRIVTPPEFVKRSAPQHITASLLVPDGPSAQTMAMRFREDLVVPLSETAARALDELKAAVREAATIEPDSTLHLRPDDLPEGSVLLVDNRRWLHGRNPVKDPERHLRRVRWDAVPFGKASNHD